MFIIFDEKRSALKQLSKKKKTKNIRWMLNGKLETLYYNDRLWSWIRQRFIKDALISFKSKLMFNILNQNIIEDFTKITLMETIA